MRGRETPNLEVGDSNQTHSEIFVTLGYFYCFLFHILELIIVVLSLVSEAQFCFCVKIYAHNGLNFYFDLGFG